MRERLKYLGVPPHTEISFTVPHTQSLPISPPGKKRGFITKLSVLKTSLSHFKSIYAPSFNLSSSVLDNAGSNMLFISSEVFFPPLP